MTEVTENEVQTISLNDKEYKVDELSDKAKYLVSQVQDMQTQANQTRAKLDQIRSRYYEALQTCYRRSWRTQPLLKVK